MTKLSRSIFFVSFREKIKSGYDVEIVISNFFTALYLDTGPFTSLRTDYHPPSLLPFDQQSVTISKTAMYFLIIQCNHSGIGEVSDFIFRKFFF